MSCSSTEQNIGSEAKNSMQFEQMEYGARSFGVPPMLHSYCCWCFSWQANAASFCDGERERNACRVSCMRKS